jgi:hypothetical protein
MGVYAVLEVHGQVVTVTDPSGGTCNAAGDFDRLLPVTDAGLPILSRIDPCGELRVPHADLDAVSTEAGILLGRAANGLERRGLLRLRALVSVGRSEPGAELLFVGD